MLCVLIRKVNYCSLPALADMLYESILPSLLSCGDHDHIIQVAKSLASAKLDPPASLLPILLSLSTPQSLTCISAFPDFCDSEVAASQARAFFDSDDDDSRIAAMIFSKRAAKVCFLPQALNDTNQDVRKMAASQVYDHPSMYMPIILGTLSSPSSSASDRARALISLGNVTAQHLPS